MRAQSIIGILLGTLATAAIAQVASAPVEPKGAGNVQVEEAVTAANRATAANSVNGAAPRDEATPADAPNGVAPIEPKL